MRRDVSVKRDGLRADDSRLLCLIQSFIIRVWFVFVSTCKHVSWLQSPPPVL